MSCCEDRDLAYRSAMPHPSWNGRAVLIRYAGARSIAVTGIGTLRVYRFSGIAREQHVDFRDAGALLRNSWFRAVGVVRIDAETAGNGLSPAPSPE